MCAECSANYIYISDEGYVLIVFNNLLIKSLIFSTKHNSSFFPFTEKEITTFLLNLNQLNLSDWNQEVGNENMKIFNPPIKTKSIQKCFPVT